MKCCVVAIVFGNSDLPISVMCVQRRKCYHVIYRADKMDHAHYLVSVPDRHCGEVLLIDPKWSVQSFLRTSTIHEASSVWISLIASLIRIWAVSCFSNSTSFGTPACWSECIDVYPYFRNRFISALRWLSQGAIAPAPKLCKHGSTCFAACGFLVRYHQFLLPINMRFIVQIFYCDLSIDLFVLLLCRLIFEGINRMPLFFLCSFVSWSAVLTPTLQLHSHGQCMRQVGDLHAMVPTVNSGISCSFAIKLAM